VSLYRLTAGAKAELGEILDWSENRFGAAARDRYAALILIALRNVADDPHQANIHWRRIGKTDIGIHHIAHSRDRVPPDPGRVAEPRHCLVFSSDDGVGIVILGFVHERMLLGRAFRRLLQR
jgi:toxin ParE1/3/4